jgi:hypothetical protein
LPAATDAIDQVGPLGIELGLHGLRGAVLRHDLEPWRTGGPAVGARLPLEPNKITKPSAARGSETSSPTAGAHSLALKAEHVTVARIGERHQRDEVPHILIISGTEPVDPDRPDRLRCGCSES